MLYKIPVIRMQNIAPLFSEWNETLIWSCLQGCMGEAWADDIENPKIAQIYIGDFCFVAGDSRSESAYNLVENKPDNYKNSMILMVPQDDDWDEVIKEVYGNKVEQITRYAFQKEEHSFNQTKLNEYIQSLEKEYKLIPIEKDLFKKTKLEEWSKDFCSQFIDYEDYRLHGIGYVILHNEEIVCGASSYTYYEGGIEIEIGTHLQHRRKGLATICASKLILECLKRDLHPSWDAANQASRMLAEKLGYQFANEYITYVISA